jgi:hypothetical protein
MSRGLELRRLAGLIFAILILAAPSSRAQAPDQVQAVINAAYDAVESAKSGNASIKADDSHVVGDLKAGGYDADNEQANVTAAMEIAIKATDSAVKAAESAGAKKTPGFLADVSKAAQEALDAVKQGNIQNALAAANRAQQNAQKARNELRTAPTPEMAAALKPLVVVAEKTALAAQAIAQLASTDPEDVGEAGPVFEPPGKGENPERSSWMDSLPLYLSGIGVILALGALTLAMMARKQLAALEAKRLEDQSSFHRILNETKQSNSTEKAELADRIGALEGRTRRAESSVAATIAAAKTRQAETPKESASPSDPQPATHAPPAPPPSLQPSQEALQLQSELNAFLSSSNKVRKRPYREILERYGEVLGVALPGQDGLPVLQGDDADPNRPLSAVYMRQSQTAVIVPSAHFASSFSMNFSQSLDVADIVKMMFDIDVDNSGALKILSVAFGRVDNEGRLSEGTKGRIGGFV